MSLRALRTWLVARHPICLSASVYLTVFRARECSGTMPWVADHQRRTILFRYSPANLAFAGGRHDFDRDHRSGPAWPDSWYVNLSDEQRAVLEPPYSPGAQRPIIGNDGKLLQESLEALREWGWDGIGNNRESYYPPSNPPKPKL